MSIDFSQVKLKKVERKEEPAKAPRPVLCSNSEEYDKLLKEASFENYYDYIKDYTFKSLVFKLDIATIKALVEENAKYVEFKKSGAAGDYLGWKQRKELAALASQIEKTAAELYGSEEEFHKRGVFVRLSTLSPKDAAANRQSFITETRRCLENIREMEKVLVDKWGEAKGSFSTEDNRKMYAIYTAATTTLNIKDGNYAVQLFIESGRAQQEFNMEMTKYNKLQEEKSAGSATSTGGDESSGSEPYMTNLGVVVREWANFDVSTEFRAFVYNKKLTGITQYNHQVYFPHLIQFKDQITSIVSKFTSELVNGPKAIPLNNCIIDIILSPKQPLLEYLKTHEKWNVEDLFEVKIVEMNPFAEFAGTSLFEWYKPEDWLVLSGQAPFEFRMVERVIRFVIQNLSSEWMPLYKQI